jgi:hypothetical protein
LGFDLDKLILILSESIIKMSKKCKTLSANVKKDFMKEKKKMGRK